MTVDEIVRAEEREIERFEALGLGRYDAIEAVDARVDRQTLERLADEVRLTRARGLGATSSAASSRTIG